MIYLPRIQMIVSTSPRQTVPPAFVPVGRRLSNGDSQRSVFARVAPLICIVPVQVPPPLGERQ
jgi:hypothetical protein